MVLGMSQIQEHTHQHFIQRVCCGNVVIDAIVLYLFTLLFLSLSLLLGLAEIAAHSMLMLVSFLSPLACSAAYF